MASWPVSDRCKGHLHELMSSHNIQPLPVYDENHNLIPPSQYESKLKGALVKVHMAICHHHIKSSKRDIFNVILRELIVLTPPAAMPTSPFKRRRLNKGPSTKCRNKGKTPIRGRLVRACDSLIINTNSLTSHSDSRMCIVRSHNLVALLPV